MITIKKIYHFLGSIYLAIGLIAATALFAIAGTFLESLTESHRYAARLTYGHPLFNVLLWLFFVNILVSALRRWPFKMRHIPFLTTHLGLLMILAGAIVKSYFGTQATLGVLEGGTTQEAFLADTYAIQIEKRDPIHPHRKATYRFLLEPTFWNGLDLRRIDRSPEKPPFTLSILEYLPNVRERFETWIKGDEVTINGVPPFAVYKWPDAEVATPLPVSLQHSVFSEADTPWNLIATRTPDPESLAKKAYLQGLDVVLSDRTSDEHLTTIPLAEALEHPVKFSKGEATFTLHFNFSSTSGFEHPELMAHIHLVDQMHGTLKIPLDGSESLLNINTTTPYLGSFPVAIDLKRIPAIVWIEDLHQDVSLLAFDATGSVHAESFRADNLSSLIVYDRGYGGYAMQASLPIPSFPHARKDKEAANLYDLKQQLRQVIQEPKRLSPPLALLYHASQRAQVDFIEVLVDFLETWDRSHHWLYPTHHPIPPSVAKVMPLIEWDTASEEMQQGCEWVCQLFELIEPKLLAGEDLPRLINGIPALRSLHLHLDGDPYEALKELTQQILLAAMQVPSLIEEKAMTPKEQARRLSVYMRAYGLDLAHLSLPAGSEEVEKRLEAYALKQEPAKKCKGSICLKCPVSMRYEACAPTKKMENNLPQVTVSLKTDDHTEILSLAYDRFGAGLKWPTSNGEYLVRFQPQFQKLPYRVRLRDARQINYPQSGQPFSYESDLLITDVRSDKVVETTLSMNQVHETWDGYRFYLANILPPAETAAQRAQIIVNHDPGKYFLTYPGAIFLTLGILLLFWMRPYKA